MTTIFGDSTEQEPSPLTVDVTTISNSYVTASETSWVTASGDDWVTAAEEFSHIDTPLSVYNMELSTPGAPSVEPSGRLLPVLQNKFRDAVRRFLPGKAYNPNDPQTAIRELRMAFGLCNTARPQHLYLAHQ